jgi:histone-lysine N-methyltransferase SETMAR
VTIAWNLLGFHVLDPLPKGRIFYAEYCRDHSLAALVALRTEAGGRRHVVHVNNAKAHTAQKWIAFCTEHGLRSATHPAYSPDLAPSDFVLFGNVKNCLQGMVFALHKEALAAKCEIVTGIPKETLHRVFDHWMEGLE